MSNIVPEQHGNFKLLANVPLSYADSRVCKWESQKTGLKVVWLDVEGPLVQGYFSTITEIFDDSGRPHCLEHLIFLGSEKYPYKGVLDTVSNRMFANGTNAWTDTTNTTYTVGTAGAEGFLRIMPVYLDHVLYPTMTDAGFVTEVHHINGKGEDAGVVYAEMNGRENGSGDLMALKLQRTLFSKLNGYRSETGGLMEALRVLKIEDIREYHASAYVPQNITLIVAGRSLKPTDLLETLTTEIEPSIEAHNQAKGPRPKGWKRPFVESSTALNPAKLTENLVETVEFPEQDESVGEVQISWIGHEPLDFLSSLALEVLSNYLSDSAVSPLYKEFVEIEDPYCTDIYFESSTQKPSILTIYLSSVPAEHLDTIGTKVIDFLRSLGDAPIDMERMKNQIVRQRLKLLSVIETDPADALMDAALTDALFGNANGSDLAPQLDDVDYYTIEGWKEEDWLSLLKKYYIDGYSATIIGKPSASLSEKLEREGKERVAETVKTQGPEGLKKLEKKLTDAQAENDAPIPDEVIKQFKVPDVEGIEWIKVDTARSTGVAQDGKTRNNEAQQVVDADDTKLPIFVQYDHIQSSFVKISIVLFPSPELSQEILQLLPFYLDSFFSLPVTRSDGTELAYDEVVNLLDTETLYYSIDAKNPLQESVTLKIQVSHEKYEAAVRWARDLLLGSKFSIDRLKIVAGKASQNLPGEKRDGNSISSAASRQLTINPQSINHSLNLLTRVETVPAFIERLNTDPEGVVKDLDTLRKGLVNPKSLRVSVAGNIAKLQNPASLWANHFSFPFFDKSELVKPTMGKDVLSELGQNPSKKMVLYGISSIESSFAVHAAKGPASSTHPDYPALTVARSIMNAMEGFLWKHIRGAGLAYGADIMHDPETGLVWFRIFKSPDSFAAFKAGQQLIDDIISDKIQVTEIMLESAKSSLAYRAASSESTIAEAATQSFVNQVLHDLPQSFQRDMLSKTKDVTKTDVLRVLKDYIAPIFKPETSIAGISSGLVKMDSIVESFEKLGWEIEKRQFSGNDEDSEDGSESDSWSEISHDQVDK